MRVILETKTKIGVGEFAVCSGEVLRVGRTAPAELMYPDDAYMSALHFAVECSSVECRVRDLDTRNGTFVNGILVKETTIQHGDRISAGQTKFRVRIESESPPPSPVNGAAHLNSPMSPPSGATSSLSEPQLRLLAAFRQEAEPLVAILDAARDDQVLDFLRKSGEEYQSLYEGKQRDDLANQAPYLVRLPQNSDLLLKLIRSGWGASWGVYLTCSKPLSEVRRHFRHFLLVQTEGGKEFYFRFYDPRVLRAFLPTCDAQESAEFFGPVVSFLMENENGRALLKFASSSGEVLQQSILLAAGAQSS